MECGLLLLSTPKRPGSIDAQIKWCFCLTYLLLALDWYDVPNHIFLFVYRDIIFITNSPLDHTQASPATGNWLRSLSFYNLGQEDWHAMFLFYTRHLNFSPHESMTGTVFSVRHWVNSASGSLDSRVRSYSYRYRCFQVDLINRSDRCASYQ